eukprot:3027900-Pyramimonas_sp.AAC.1
MGVMPLPTLGCAVMQAAAYLSHPMFHSRGRIYAPPFTTDLIREVWALACTPYGSHDIGHLDPPDCPVAWGLQEFIAATRRDITVLEV